MNNDAAVGRADLTQCDREPIHIPAAIQPHGVLLVLREPALVVDQISENAHVLLERSVEQILGSPLSAVLDAGCVEAIQRAIEDPDAEYLNPLALQARGRHFDGIVHRHDGALILELEPTIQVETGGHQTQALRRALIALQSAQTIDEVCNRAAQEVRRLTGFERVLVYQFNETGAGSVAAESKDESLESYLGLHYPASDIPQQARQLYLKNWLRIIPDARYSAARILPTLRVDTPRPLDLSFSVLRSVSPVHLEYMANMGVRASMSISLVIEGRLWGLISCANHSATRFVPFEMRSACEVLGRLTSRQIAAVAEHEAFVQREARRGVRGRLKQGLLAGEILEGVLAHPQELLALVNAQGVAVVRAGESQAFGSTPPCEAVAELAAWLDQLGYQAPYSTSSLSSQFPGGAPLSDVASGILTFALPGVPRRRVIWFRPELLKNVMWGGDPRKPLESEPSTRISPRKSFESWKQEVRLTSVKWTASDVEAAEELRRDALEIDLERQVLREQRAVRARDDLVAVVSHDLRNPLGVIQMQAAILLKTVGAADEEFSRRIHTSVDHIQRSVGRMNTLIRDLLDLAKLEAGRFTLRREMQQMNDLLDESLMILRPLAEAKQITLSSRLDGAVVNVDRDRIFQVFSNLVGNAIKFTPTGGSVDLACLASDEQVRITVSDSGPGISAEQAANVFDRYWQARKDDHDGSGLGLFIAKGIVEAHGGKIWTEIREGVGATFVFTLPKV